MKKITLLIIFLISYFNTFSQIEVTPQELSKKLSPQELKLLYLIKTDKLNRDEFTRDKSFNNYIENSKLEDIFKAALLKNLYFYNKTSRDIYGIDIKYSKDNRTEVQFTNNDTIRKNSNGIVLIVNNSLLKKSTNNSFKLETTNLVDDPMIKSCDSERFVKQPSIAYKHTTCTGFIVGKNVLITAGHCILSNADLMNKAFILDYRLNNDESKNIVIKKSQIITGKKVQRVGKNKKGLDYAIIRTNEEMDKSRILNLNWNSKIEVNQALYTIGHPLGLPQKLADKAWVTKNNNPYIFNANLDTFAGNSGGPVFNRNTHEVEGFLLSGGQDYKFKDKSQTCRIVNTCGTTGCITECPNKNNCYGETIVRNSVFLKALKDVMNNIK
ncbi:serine protease [Tenacibaculum sp. 190524A05c]|uniref:trypsin-like serine peptidase n=1 Tax=Tenacibaculum platacis TaxID=3137852 RepID=UPI0032B2F5C6